MKVILLLLFTFLLSNCATKTNYIGLEDRKKLVGDSDLKRNYSYYKSGMSITKASMPTLYSEFINTKVELAKTPKTIDKIENYINAGIALSNRTCSLWFDGQYSTPPQNSSINFIILHYLTLFYILF